MLRGIRGATTVQNDEKEEIWQAARTLVTKILSMNGISNESVGAIIFSSTKDLTSAFPTTGLRKLKAFRLVPLFDTVEPDIEGSLRFCIRVLLLVDTDLDPQKICHVYLGGAQNLRPDLKNS